MYMHLYGGFLHAHCFAVHTYGTAYVTTYRTAMSAPAARPSQPTFIAIHPREWTNSKGNIPNPIYIDISNKQLSCLLPSDLLICFGLNQNSIFHRCSFTS